MTIPAPSLLLRFAQAPGILDPRATFTRASTANTYDRRGRATLVPAGAPRWRYNPYSRAPEGLMLEEARTNLALYSEQFDNAAWTKVSASITADSVAAPDGNTTADTLTVSGADGAAKQAVTITAGNAVTLSCHVKQLTSAFAALWLTDGTSTVTAWFNLASGAVGSATAGAGNVGYVSHSMERLAGGWWRVQVTVSTSVIVSITGNISCAAANSTAPAAADSIYLWGGQAEQPGSTSTAGTYVQTAGSTVTRSGDSLVFSSLGGWFNQDEGTLLIEWVGREARLSRVLFALSGSGGFSDSTYVTRPSAAQLQLVSGNGGVGQVSAFKDYSLVAGTISKLALRYRANDVAWSLNGDAVGTDLSASFPTFTRLGIGGDWSATPSSQWSQPLRMFAYFPTGVSNAALQTLSQQ